MSEEVESTNNCSVTSTDKKAISSLKKSSPITIKLTSVTKK